MAEREIYRVEIPIIVDDQTDAPLKQAERKISKFEKSAQMETEKIRKHFQHIAKYQIEPVMKVRDQLTANVLKADKLIRKLDLDQASPLIAAQDRVSAVVTRINAMLDALDKGKVDVVAEMQGPLLDEIIKARAALSDLNNVKAGPIAELRGELFGQLAKAMSQIKGLDLARAEPQATLRERVTWKVKEISSSLRGLTSRAWTVTLQAKDKVTSTIKSILNKLTSPLALLGAGTGLGAGIFFSLKLAGEMEQAGIAMEFFTESAAKGQEFLKELQTFAAKTPFEFPDVRDAAVGLMPIYKQMYGVDEAMKQTMRTIAAFGDAAGLTGAGIQGMNLALLGFRQIGTIGKLSMEELRQVTENLLIPMNIILDELGLTGDALDNLAKEGIEAKRAMEAIVRALEKNFAGGMEKMSNSLLGLTSTIKDTANLTVWHFGKGLAGPVKRILLDIVGMTDETGGAFERFQRNLYHTGRRIGLRIERFYRDVKAFFRELSQIPGWDRLPWDEKLSITLDRVIDRLQEWTFTTTVFETGAKFGLTVAKGVASGFTKALADDPVAAFVLGGLAGLFVPGPLSVKATLFLSVAGPPLAMKVWEFLVGQGEAAGRRLPGTGYYIEAQIEKQKQAYSLLDRPGYVGDFRILEAGGQVPQRPVFEGQTLSAAKPGMTGNKVTDFLIRFKEMWGFASGGILTRPHVGLVAEAGPEAIIPLSSSKRSRGLQLWEQAGRWLGVHEYADGGVVGNYPIAASIPGGPNVNVTLNLDFAGLINQVIIEKESDIDEVFSLLAHKVKSKLRNMIQS